MDLEQLLPLLIILPMLTGMGGSGGGGGPLFDNSDFASHNHMPVGVPIALAVGTINVSGVMNVPGPPPGVPERRRSLDRRGQPHPGRRATDPQSGMHHTGAGWVPSVPANLPRGAMPLVFAV